MAEFVPGVHFGLVDAEYHAVPALSASGVKHLRVSPLDYWVHSAMNPNQAEVLADDESDAKEIGSAYDVRITGGRDAFLASYAPALTMDDCPGALETTKDIEAAMKAAGVPHSQGDKAAKIDRLLAASPTAKIFDVIRQGYEAEHDGKSFLPRKLMDKIELAAAMIEKHPKLGKAFTGGAPQVSLFWVDPETNVPCKARLDYLKPRAIVDLKTFSNPFKRPVSRAIDQAFANYRYFIQATHYSMGAKHIAGHIKAERVFGNPDVALIEALLRDEAKLFLFVWQAMGPAPIARGRVFPETSNFYTIAKDELNFHMRTYAECLAKFGSDPWVSDDDIDEFDDMNLPAWAAE